MIQKEFFKRKNFLKDLIIASIIVVLPFLFFTHVLVPRVQIWETPFFRIESTYYGNVNIFVWTAFTKLWTLIILSLWFITCKHWWRYAILVPIVIETIKFYIVLNDEIHFLDTYEYLYSLPLTIPIVLLLIYISKRLKYYNKSVELDSKIEEEIDLIMEALPSLNLNKIKDQKNQFESLLQKKGELDSKEYLKELLKLRSNINLTKS